MSDVAPWPWKLIEKEREEWEIHDQKNEILLSETAYYPMVILSPADFRLIQKAPEMLKAIRSGSVDEMEKIKEEFDGLNL
jgi:hypothetical protein